MVTVIPGSPQGLNTHGAFALNQNSPGMPGTPESPDMFGYSLAAGATRSGEPFLVLGVPNESIGNSRSGAGAGAVAYVRGSRKALIHQDTAGVPGGAEQYDHFGRNVAATRDHVAVSSPGEDLVHNGTRRENAGSAHLIGHALTSPGTPRWARMIHQDSPGVSGAPESGDSFGSYGGIRAQELSAVAYRPDGVTDDDAGSLVAVGVPGEDLGAHDSLPRRGYGVVQLLYVSRSGDVRQVWNLHQGTRGVAGGAEPRDRFGETTMLFGTRDGEAATPMTARLLVAVPGESADDAGGAFQLFTLSGDPGEGDVWIGNGRFGLHYTGSHIGATMATTAADLYLKHAYGQEVYVVPWSNITDGTSRPVDHAGPVRSTYTAGAFGTATR